MAYRKNPDGSITVGITPRQGKKTDPAEELKSELAKADKPKKTQPKKK